MEWPKSSRCSERQNSRAIFADNTTALAYLLKLGGTKSGELFVLVRENFEFGRGQASSANATVHQRLEEFDRIRSELLDPLRLWLHHQVDLFATKLNILQYICLLTWTVEPLPETPYCNLDATWTSILFFHSP